MKFYDLFEKLGQMFNPRGVQAMAPTDSMQKNMQGFQLQKLPTINNQNQKPLQFNKPNQVAPDAKRLPMPSENIAPNAAFQGGLNNINKNFDTKMQGINNQYQQQSQNLNQKVQSLNPGVQEPKKPVNFNQAFGEARKKGLKTFDWKGKSYGTELKKSSPNDSQKTIKKENNDYKSDVVKRKLGPPYSDAEIKRQQAEKNNNSLNNVNLQNLKLNPGSNNKVTETMPINSNNVVAKADSTNVGNKNLLSDARAQFKKPQFQFKTTQVRAGNSGL